MDHLALSKGEIESGNHHLSSLSSATSIDNTSISSASNIHGSDDSNSSSGNGSDSDEFSPPTSGERSPCWEQLPNISSFQSYPIEDVVFCHADTLHPSTLVWVVRHLTKMVALITAFRSRSEAEELFQKYRDLRLKVKPANKYKMNSTGGTLVIPPAPTISAPPPPPPRTCSVLSSALPEIQYASLPSIHPTEILHETKSENQVFSIPNGKFGESKNCRGLFGFTENETSPSSSGTMPRAFNFQRGNLQTFPNDIENDEEIHDKVLSDLSESDSDEESDGESQVTRIRAPIRPNRKVQLGIGKNKSGSSQPVLLVPLKNESVSSPRSSYPKESYLYHVMGRTSSTFAPYQRSLNLVPTHTLGANGTEYLTWANSNGRHLLVPFSSWMEISEMRKQHHGQHGPSPAPTRRMELNQKSYRRGVSKTSALSHLSGKGTAKILLRDSTGHPHGVWANLSQRVKQNFRENLMPKLNGMWTQPGDYGNKVKKKTNKKVTFNAWATVQMV